jgi:hypothetical protein
VNEDRSYVLNGGEDEKINPDRFGMAPDDIPLDHSRDGHGLFLCGHIQRGGDLLYPLEAPRKEGADPPSFPFSNSSEKKAHEEDHRKGGLPGSASGSSTGSITQDSLHKEDVRSTTSLLSWVNENTGIIFLNQAWGNLNNQVNL